MKKAIAAIVLLAACAGGGFAAGYMLRPSCGAAQPAKDDSELAAKLEKAQKRIASLEKQLEGTKKSALASKKASSKLKKLLVGFLELLHSIIPGLSGGDSGRRRWSGIARN